MQKSNLYREQKAKVLGYLIGKKYKSSYSDMASHLNVDMQVIVDTCKELHKKGKLAYVR